MNDSMKKEKTSGAAAAATETVDASTDSYVKVESSGTLPPPSELRASSESLSSSSSSANPPIPWWRYENECRAQGYAILGFGRGALIMSNIFLSSAFIDLANDAAGCTEIVNGEQVVIEDCPYTVYGMKPASLVANIAVISGVLSALLMPFAGAIIDCTSYRRAVGMWTAVLMVLIQAVQAYLTEDTWFAMAILQAFAAFLYQVQILCIYAYLPEMARIVGEKLMTNMTATFQLIQFGSQAFFLVAIVGLSFALGISDDDVKTARYSQAINAVWVSIPFYFGWKLLPSVPALQSLPENQTLFTHGFIKVWHTAKVVNRDFKKGLRWYFLGLIFAEAAVNSFTVVSVVYLDEHIGLSGTEIGIFFLATLIASLPGTKLGAWVTHRTNPSRSFRICMACLVFVTVVGAILVDTTVDAIAYLWAICIGILLGWFYPTQNLYFSMILPKGQEAEFSGFYVYCSQVLAWAPPLLFSALVTANISQTFGVVSVSFFLVIAIGILSCAASWPEILEESHQAADPEKGDSEIAQVEQQSTDS